jgi:hypothetical protein
MPPSPSVGMEWVWALLCSWWSACGPGYLACKWEYRVPLGTTSLRLSGSQGPGQRDRDLIWRLLCWARRVRAALDGWRAAACHLPRCRRPGKIVRPVLLSQLDFSFFPCELLLTKRVWVDGPHDLTVRGQLSAFITAFWVRMKTVENGRKRIYDIEKRKRSVRNISTFSN